MIDFFRYLGICFITILFSWLPLSVVHASSSNFWQISTVPSWTEADLNSPQIGEGLESLEYLLYDAQVNLNLDVVQSFYQYRYQVNDAAGVEDNSDLSITFSPDYQTVVMHKVEVIRNGQSSSRLVEHDVRLVDIEPEKSSKIYSGQKQLQLWLKDIRAGDVIEYSYSIVGSNPVFEGHYSHFFKLGWGIEVKQANVSVIAPNKRKLNHQLIKTDVKINVDKRAKESRYSLSLTDVPAYYSDGDEPSWEFSQPYWLVSDFDDWKGVNDWALGLFEHSPGKSNEFDHWLEELQALPKQTAVEQAISFVQQDIRYLGIELGENSHRPHAPAEVFDNRYGDCKDKSFLLVTALKSLGIDAYPVLVSTYNRNTVRDFIPAYNLFNHAIVRFDFNGNEYWIDPTKNYQATSLNYIVQSSLGDALVVAKGNSSLSEMPDYQAIDNRIIFEQTYKAADYQSPVELLIKSTYTGTQADRMRYRVASKSAKRMSKEYLEYYQRLYPKLSSLQAVQVVDDANTNQLTISESYLVPEFWTIADGEAVFELYSDLVDDYLYIPEKVNRQQSLALGSPLSVYQSSHLVLPQDVDFSSLIAHRSEENDYISFSSSFDYQNRTISFNHAYSNKARSVPPQDTEQHIELLRKARKRLSISYSVTNVTEDEAYGSVAKLVNYLLSLKQTRAAEVN
ncbi:DUF3857 domain-containing protein [Agarivorans sp. TSD2052]|uniref:DUF3857 domain-containing transglutaminase family protein n=1 Tax=Agarivorans sp. TSD2052 TaxID=2937286 RepID=UPI00200D7F5E|nr:DUF3857 domain-containing protein [Agarivorans sp. TSD2052]UPW19687.1 DUF3857 domain-containing protein [Agarivorans sp. TSD2052]